MQTMTDDDKRLAAEAAVLEVRDAMIVGLGTGSTARHAIEAIGRRVRAGLSIRAVATSRATEALAQAAGIMLIDFAAVTRLDLTIDGADEIDARWRCIKGAGGAMLREKAVAEAADRMVVIADASKQVAAIGAAAVPVEMLPFARSFVTERLRALGAAVTLRDGSSDNGNAIADCRFAPDADWRALAAGIAAIPGALGHGLFLDEVDAAYVAREGVVTRLERRTPTG